MGRNLLKEKTDYEEVTQNTETTGKKIEKRYENKIRSNRKNLSKRKIKKKIKITNEGAILLNVPVGPTEMII